MLSKLCKSSLFVGAAKSRDYDDVVLGGQMNSFTRTDVSLSRTLEQKLNLYVLAAGAAGAGLLVTALPAEAKVVFTLADSTITGGRLVIDLNHDGVNDFTLLVSADSRGHSDPKWLSILPDASQNRIMAGKNIFAIDLPAGIKVGPQNFPVAGRMSMAYENPAYGTVGTYSLVLRGAWANNGEGAKNRFLGFEFTIDGQTHFGWARLTVPPHTKDPLWPTATLSGYAFETVPNKGIVTGDIHGTEEGVSENSGSLGRLALGALSMSSQAEASTNR